MNAKKYSVSEITELIKQKLENSFGAVSIEGEISNCRPSSTGHLYFTLKDNAAAISAVMFKGSLRGLDFKPADGALVRVSGRISVYAQRGSYQIICETMELAGSGDILAMLEKRKQLLAAQGLFDERAKKPLPSFPETVAVVSSPTGAAVRDIINVLGRRSAGLKVIILPAPVQGAQAAPIIARRIEQANFWKLADVLIVGRGGGSLEDLLPFSEECVVRAVAASRIPVVSAVGHEIDWALCDFAADLRAPTPSAAAELISQNQADICNAVRSLQASLYNNIAAHTERARLKIKPFSTTDLEMRFMSILQPRLIRFDDAKEALLEAARNRISELRRRLELAHNTLDSASPFAVLERGFSVVTNTRTGRVVRAPADTALGDILDIRLKEGRITAVSNP